MACSSSRVHCNGLVFVSAYPAVSGRVSLLLLVPNGFAVRSFKYLQKIVNFLSVMPGKQRPDDRSVFIPRLGATELPKGGRGWENYSERVVLLCEDNIEL